MKDKNQHHPTQNPSVGFLVEEDDVASLTSTKSYTTSTTTTSTIQLSSVIGGYQFAEPDPDDPFAEAGGELVPCSVGLASLDASLDEEYHEKVKRFRFDQFHGLTDFMTDRRQRMETNDPVVLQEVQDCFREIVQSIIVD